MKKDKTILRIIEKVKSILDFELLKVVDHWSSDLCAIGIQRGRKLVYISTFNFVDKDEVKYDYDLELVDMEDKSNINVLKEVRGASEKELIKELKEFLKT